MSKSATATSPPMPTQVTELADPRLAAATDLHDLRMRVRRDRSDPDTIALDELFDSLKETVERFVDQGTRP